MGPREVDGMIELAGKRARRSYVWTWLVDGNCVVLSWKHVDGHSCIGVNARASGKMMGLAPMAGDGLGRKRG